MPRLRKELLIQTIVRPCLTFPGFVFLLALTSTIVFLAIGYWNGFLTIPVRIGRLPQKPETLEMALKLGAKCNPIAWF